MLAIPDRLAPNPEPLRRIWLRRVRVRAAATAPPHTRHISGTSAASLAHQYMQQTGRTRLVHTSSGSWPLRRRAEPVAHTAYRTASAERRLDADTTISVDIGAHSGDKIGPEVDSAPVRVRAGDTRSAACTKTSRATPSHLAAPFAPEQLPQYQRIPGTSAASLAHQYMQHTLAWCSRQTSELTCVPCPLRRRCEHRHRRKWLYLRRACAVPMPRCAAGSQQRRRGDKRAAAATCSTPQSARQARCCCYMQHTLAWCSRQTSELPCVPCEVLSCLLSSERCGQMQCSGSSFDAGRSGIASTDSDGS